MRAIHWAALALVLAAASACSDGGGGSDDWDPPEGLDANANDDLERLVNSRWILVDVAGQPALPSPPATLEFAPPDGIQGNSSCNGFGGKVRFDNRELTTTDLAQTSMGCGVAVNEQEARYMRGLVEVERFEFDGEELLLHTQAYDAPLRFRLAVRPESSGTAQATPAPDTPGAGTGLAPLASGSRQETAVVAFQGEIVVIGGFDGHGQVSNLVEAYAPATNSWRRLPDIPTAMHHANAAVVGDRIYVVGFLTGANFAADGRIYVLEAGADRWELAGTMPEGKQRGSSGVAVIDGKIYLAGGLRNGAVTDFSRFDPATGNWEDLPPVPWARDHMVAGAIGGKFVLAGGRGGAITSITGRVDIFDPATGAWATGAQMLTPREGTAGAVLGGKLYVFGGEGNAVMASGVFQHAEATIRPRTPGSGSPRWPLRATAPAPPPSAATSTSPAAQPARRSAPCPPRTSSRPSNGVAHP